MTAGNPVPETDAAAEPEVGSVEDALRIGVFPCKCGKNIGAVKSTAAQSI